MKKILKRLSIVAACLVMVFVTGLAFTACDKNPPANDETDAVAYAKKLLQAGNGTNYTVTTTANLGSSTNKTSVARVSYLSGTERVYYTEGTTVVYYEIEKSGEAFILNRYSTVENIFYQSEFDSLDELEDFCQQFFAARYDNSMFYTYEMVLRYFIMASTMENFGYDYSYSITGNNGNYTLTQKTISGTQESTGKITVANNKIQKYEVTSPDGTLTTTFEYNTQAKVLENKDSFTKSNDRDPFLPLSPIEP